MRGARSTHKYRLAYNSARTRMRRLERDLEVLTLVRRVAAHQHVALDDILRLTRGNAAIAKARQLSIYLAHVQLGRSQEAVGRLFGRDRTTVAHACHIMEDQRDAELEAEIGRIVSGADPLRPSRRRPRRGA